MQAACGRTLRAIATISGVAAISRLSGFLIARHQPRDVVIDDVAAILAQMRGDAIGAGRNRSLGGLDWIGMPPAARVADGGDVVDVDAEAQEGSHADHLVPILQEARKFTRSPARRSPPPSLPAIAR